MEWWESVVLPMRRVWIAVVKRLRSKKTGLGRLRQEVSTCEYEDVHVMWEMLSKTETRFAGRSRVKENAWAGICGWAPCNLCRGF